MKLCKDCKHARAILTDSPRCVAPQNMNIDPVSGALIPYYSLCETHRTGIGVGLISRYATRACGTRPRWFEPKEE